MTSYLPSGEFSYDDAFSRHLGLITPEEQARLRRSRVAIVGMGGVGGVHLMTLARLGIGAFHVADPDTFELANFNRQYGASMRSLGRSKLDVMIEEAREINPELDIQGFREPIGPPNIEAFLEGVDIVIDGIDFFAIEARRLIFREARRRGAWALTAGPLGFGAAYLIFSPTGMTFDEYFDLRDGMNVFEQLVSFMVGLAPRATQRTYMDLSQVDAGTGRGPSSGLACQICGGIVAAETLKILLGRGPVRPAPYFFQFDAYRQMLVRGRMPWGNRNPWQRIKRQIVRSAVIKMGLDQSLAPSKV